jgi:hypothetical protein
MSYFNKLGLQISWQKSVPYGWEDLDVELCSIVEDGFIANKLDQGPDKITIDKYNYVVFGWDGRNPYTIADATLVCCEHMEIFGSPRITALRIVITID